MAKCPEKGRQHLGGDCSPAEEGSLRQIGETNIKQEGQELPDSPCADFPMTDIYIHPQRKACARGWVFDVSVRGFVGSSKVGSVEPESALLRR